MADIDYLDFFLYGTNQENSILTEPLELFFQEIELAIKLMPNSVWGIKDSINLNRYLFNRYVTLTQVRNEITSYIAKNCQHASLFPYTITTDMIKSVDNKELIYIVVTVDSIDINGIQQSYSQKFLLGS